LTHPVYKIETWTAAVKDHTITSDAVNLYFKDEITNGIGHFSFTVPTVKGTANPYYYDDIALNDTVKIWMGYDTVSGTADFIGKVKKISALSKNSYVRMISGLSQGEILLRRLKQDTLWSAVGASTIVTELADDLGLGKDIVADATAVDMEVQTKTYFDVLQAVSDYWANAGTQVKKDFYVDVGDNLVWKARPIRSAGVETLTVGDNILNYRVTRDVDSVRNEVDVYGAAYELPVGCRDGYTDTTTNWTSDGTVTTNADMKVGQYSIQGHRVVSPATVYLQRALTSFRCGWKNQRYVHFWSKGIRTGGVVAVGTYIHILAPNYANRFSKFSTTFPFQNVWFHDYFELGPHGGFSSTGSPDWTDVQGIRFTYDAGAASTAATFRVDELYFTGGHYYNTATDAGSQTSYGRRDLQVFDERLTSNADCQKRAETILYQRKDAPIQIEVTLPLNMNVKAGDRLSMTIPAEGITAQDYDVISVQHSGNSLSFTTYAVMVNTSNIRQPLETSMLQALISNRKKLRTLYDDVKTVG